MFHTLMGVHAKYNHNRYSWIGSGDNSLIDLIVPVREVIVLKKLTYWYTSKKKSMITSQYDFSHSHLFIYVLSNLFKQPVSCKCMYFNSASLSFHVQL